MQNPISNKLFVRFERLPDLDRAAYEKILDINDSVPGTYTRNQVFADLSTILNNKSIHQSLRGKVFNLLYGTDRIKKIVTREGLTKLLDQYEDHLIHIAPTPFPNEDPEEYAERVNFPLHLANEITEVFQDTKEDDDDF